MSEIRVAFEESNPDRVWALREAVKQLLVDQGVKVLVIEDHVQ